MEVQQYSMKQVRPSTAGKELHSARGDIRMTLLQITRPYSARNQNLRHIIQVIQKTLTRGAQQALSRSKSKQKDQKSKRKVFEFTSWRTDRERPKRQHQISKCKTQCAVSPNTAPQSTPSFIKYSKNPFYYSCDLEEFVPYMQQEGHFRKITSPSKVSPPIKKLTKKRTTLKENAKQNVKEIKKAVQQSLIEKWQVDPLLNLSGLLDLQIR